VAIQTHVYRMRIPSNFFYSKRHYLVDNFFPNIMLMHLNQNSDEFIVYYTENKDNS